MVSMNDEGQPLGPVKMTAESKHDLRSVTKSVVSALVGIAHGEGKIQSLDEPIVKWFPEYSDLDTPDRRRVTLAHALSMTSGFDWNEDVPYNDPRNDEIRMTRDPQPLRYALARPFARDPGDDFKYNGGLTQVVAAVLIEARTAVGNGQQRVFVLPTMNMVVTIFAGRYNDFTTGNTLGRRILFEHVIPAVKTGVRAGCSGA